MRHYAVMLSPRGQSGIEAKSFFGLGRGLKEAISYNWNGGPLEPSLYLYRFLEILDPRHWHIAIS